MADKLDLPATDKVALRLVADDGWCRCWLRDGNRDHYLGADTTDTIVSRLTAALSDLPEGGGRPVSDSGPVWFLSLSEAHASLYLSTIAREFGLIVQDDKGRTLATLRLPKKIRAAWLSKIQRFD